MIMSTTGVVKLDPGEYGRVRSLVEPLDFHLPLVALLAGTSPGAVYVDDAETPRALLAGTGHRFFLAGAPERTEFRRGLTRLFDDTILPRTLAAGLGGLSICVFPDGWAGHIAAILGGREVVETQHEYYHAHGSAWDQPRTLPDGYSLRAAGRALLADEGLANLDALREEMCSERPSVEDFISSSFGVCAVHGKDLVGWCLSEYNTGNRCEIGIATHEPHRRRGVATGMAGAFIEAARARGVTEIGWHCYAHNIPSGATARAAGFRLTHTYPAYHVWLKT
jgi:GNAT superfamily N-acetyltransferase